MLENPIFFSLSPLILTSSLIPVINWKSRLIILAYTLGASVLAMGPVSDVLGDGAVREQIIAWLLLGLTSAAPWLIIHGQSRIRLLTSIIACCIAILPPFGTIAAPNPFMAAGYIFPGTSVIGLLLVASFIILPIHMTTKIRIAFLILLASVSLTTNMLYHPPAPPEGWLALDTTFQDYYDDPLTKRHKRVDIIRDKITTELLAGNKVIITPETVLGTNSPGLKPHMNLLSARAKRNNATLLIGVVTKTTEGMENSLLILGEDNESPYEARQPVPLIMWKLWPTTGFKAHWFRKGVRNIQGKRTAILICWEEWVPWPMLVSFFSNPEVILSASNHGWARNSSKMWARQTISANALARLYGLPIIRAVNLPPKKL